MPTFLRRIFHRRHSSTGVEQRRSASPSPSRPSSEDAPRRAATDLQAAKEPADSGIHIKYPDDVVFEDEDDDDDGDQTVASPDTLWDSAYEELKSDPETAKLTEIYEKVLTGVCLNNISKLVGEQCIPSIDPSNRPL